MWPFKKKKDPPLINRCDHKYRGFPWYKDVTLNVFGINDEGDEYGSLSIKIYKPYVCIHCKHRKDVLLREVTRCNTTWQETIKESQDMDKTYAEHLRSPAEVEADIADFQLIDREYLKMAHELFPDRGILKEESE